MQHLRSAVFESDLQWRCSIILRVMLLQWNVGNVPSRHRRRRAAEFRAQSNDAVHTVSFTEIYLIYLGNHTNSHKWADFFTFMKMLFNFSFISMAIKKVTFSVLIVTISKFLQKYTPWRHIYERIWSQKSSVSEFFIYS